MSKAGLIALFGLIMAFLPFFGIPNVVKTGMFVVLGVLVAGLGFLVREERRHLLRALSGEHKTDAYTESGARGYAENAQENV